MRLLGQLRSPRDGTGIVSQKGADEVFLLLNAAFQIGNSFGCCEYQLLRLPDVEHGGTATFCQHLRQLQRVLTRSQRAPGDFELQVEFTKLEISCGNVADQCADDGFTRPLSSQQGCPRRLVGAAILSPEIEIPSQ